MVTQRKKVLLGVVLVFLVFSCVNVYAITGKIGNGRMIVNLEVGETLDRTIRVINDNSVDLNITLFASGDLADDVELIDENFILKAGEEKKARFLLKAEKAGTYTTKINVKFAPLEEGENGVGLSATIITKIYKDGELPEVNDEDSNADNVGDENLITGDSIKDSKESNGLLVFLGISTVVWAVILVILLYYLNSKENKKKNKINQKKRIEEIKKAAKNE